MTLQERLRYEAGKADNTGYAVVDQADAIAAAHALDAKDARIKRLEEALRDLLPVAQETCDRWPNDDCFLIPTKRARAALEDK